MTAINKLAASQLPSTLVQKPEIVDFNVGLDHYLIGKDKNYECKKNSK